MTIKKQIIEFFKDPQKMTYLFGTVTAVLGFSGLYEYGVNHDVPFVYILAQSFYGSFQILGGNGSFSEINEFPGYFFLTAFTGPMTVLIAIIWVFSSFFRHLWYRVFTPSNHYLIIGLGHMGSELALNLISEINTEDKKVFVLEKDPNNTHIESIKNKGAYVYTNFLHSEDEELLLKKLGQNAEYIFCFTGSDIENIRLGQLLGKLHEKNNSSVAQKCYIHLENKSFELFYSPLFKNVTQSGKFELHSFNYYQRGIWQWFDQYPLQNGKDTTNNETDNIRILLIGWDNVIKEAFEFVLNMGHFYYEKPIVVTIAVDEVDSVKQEIIFNYPRLFEYNNDTNHLQQALWNVELIDLQYFYTEFKKERFDYDHVLISLGEANNNAIVALNIIQHFFGSIEERNSKIGVWNESGSLIENPFVHTISEISNIMKRSEIERSDLEAESKKIQKKYKSESLHKNEWESSFLSYWSNIYAAFHGKIKRDEFSKYSSSVDKTIFKERLAKVEHTRWNAYHVLQGFSYQRTTNKARKQHDCLLSFEELKKLKPETIKYDINNVDIALKSEKISK